jgi:Lhr-like helicase
MKLVEMPTVIFPPEVVEIWAKAGITDLTDIQAQAFSHTPLMTAGRNAIVVGPTGPTT